MCFQTLWYIIASHLIRPRNTCHFKGGERTVKLMYLYSIFDVLKTLDISRWNIIRYDTQCIKFEGKTSARLRTHERHPPIASYGCLSWVIAEEWPWDIGSALYFTSITMSAQEEQIAPVATNKLRLLKERVYSKKYVRNSEFLYFFIKLSCHIVFTRRACPYSSRMVLSFEILWLHNVQWSEPKIYGKSLYAWPALLTWISYNRGMAKQSRPVKHAWSISTVVQIHRNKLGWTQR